jgi:cell division septation protein DedD
LQPGEAKVSPGGTQPVGAPETEAVAPAPAAAIEPVRREEPPRAAGQMAPAAGQTFLQVAAVSKPEAELIVSVFKKRGISALVAPVAPGQPEGALWRALVGPFNDAASVAKMRADLQAQGFKEVFIRKY